ncbi:Methyl-accepting chemotaxis protein McpG [Saezia sanguinis]|uniref:Methyl-accepting chemotaxis protein McpG n=1 Tax=Saezia sanguinis TaxID=1965230 RepID=A0A433SHT4_9BURK|nr:methyl-accepting chemotaxis protein [Saezia sanguinis]RUS68293.1 Methyl-accepting chemotaxis protein McpG [Saezia sanguinis]
MSQGDENNLDTPTELTTVLGEYVSSSSKEKGASSSALIVLIVMVFVLLGIGGYIYMQMMQMSQTQSRLSELQAQVQKTSSSASMVLSGKSDSWNALNTQATQLNNLWNELLEPHRSELTDSEPDYGAFRKAVSDLQTRKDALSRAFDSMTNSSSVAWEDIDEARGRVGTIASTADRLNASIQEAGQKIQETAQKQLLILAAVALVAALIIVVLAIIVIKQISTVRRGRGQEMSQLNALVEDLQSEAEQQRHAAQEQVAAARRVNEANQAAILRLMNELQNLAEGDLTQQATVTEDITGAIADSVNYTVEELRNLVAQVQGATEQVSKTTAVVESTSTELLASSDEQLREIRETGQSVLDVAARINNVSTQAQQSATVARQSLEAAEKGMQAVQNAIGGMNTIRDQIQDTAKRIKRLVESSQEIGEITDLIADITEQTNVLALNAAIQAASAGEAGRGFSVVAEEVQRLAERSADATRQIATLVKAIQGDMQDAMAAMERSTRGVVEGARLSDETGTAFTEIDSVTRRLASLIQQIAEQTQNEAVVANGVAENIQHIFAVTEQTADGTRSTAQQVRELARVAEQLERSVARFRIS